MTLTIDASHMLADRPAPDLSRMSVADRHAYEALYRLSETLAARGKTLSAFMIEGAMLALISEPCSHSQSGTGVRFGEVS